jgi:hypothetical protein
MNLNLQDADININIGTYAVKKLFYLHSINWLLKLIVKSILQVTLKSNSGKVRKLSPVFSLLLN